MPEEAEPVFPSFKEKLNAAVQNSQPEEKESTLTDVTEEIENTEEPPSVQAPSGPWKVLWQLLTETERQALASLSEALVDLKTFADAHGIMVEVLADGINEKAMDAVGDGLMDEEFIIYEDYIEEVRKMVKQ